MEKVEENSTTKQQKQPQKERTKEEQDVIDAERKKKKDEKANLKKQKNEKDEIQVEIKPKEPVKEIIKKDKQFYQSNAKIVRPNKNDPSKIPLPKKGEKNILITSALPYVNNEPHLGNIIGCVLSADVFSRYCRLSNQNSIYICGTDEYGTATETKALKEKCTPKDLCDKFHALHAKIYEWFDIDFDIFGRTSTPVHSEITQDFFLKLSENGYIKKEKVEQYKCFDCNLFLADRYVVGTCHNSPCTYEQAKGDQCDLCGKLCEPTKLINPKCSICLATPKLTDSWHCFIDLPLIEPQLKDWMDKAKNEWSYNSVKTSESFIKDGLRPRCITRDLKWGVKVPTNDQDLQDKVFYVWFDAPIGYLSITYCLMGDKWELWWKDPENVKLYQFMGKDNVTFHTIIFPSSQIGTKDNYTKVNHLSTTEYLNYEGTKFSKTNEVGVFGYHAQETGIPSEIWRYYLLSIRPETGDTDFFWDKFAEKTNSELNNNLGNYCHRVLSFLNGKFNGQIPLKALSGNELAIKLTQADEEFIGKLSHLFKIFIELSEKVKIRESLEHVMKISSEANLYLQSNAPWDFFKTDIERCKVIMVVLFATLRFITCLAEIYIPSFSAKVYEIINLKYDEVCAIQISHYLGKETSNSSFVFEFFKAVDYIEKINPCAPIIAESNFLI